MFLKILHSTNNASWNSHVALEYSRVCVTHGCLRSDHVSARPLFPTIEWKTACRTLLYPRYIGVARVAYASRYCRNTCRDRRLNAQRFAPGRSGRDRMAVLWRCSSFSFSCSWWRRSHSLSSSRRRSRRLQQQHMDSIPQLLCIQQ